MDAGLSVLAARRVPGTTTFVTSFRRSLDGEEPAAVVDVTMQRLAPVHYPSIQAGVWMWGAALRHHLWFFARMMDSALPVDVRWLSAYRLIEWHFLQGAGRLKLPRSSAYLALVDRVGHLLAPFSRPQQSYAGLIEQARAMAAHAQVDERTLDELMVNPRNLLQETFPAVQTMVMTVLNEHPAKAPGLYFVVRT